MDEDGVEICGTVLARFARACQTLGVLTGRPVVGFASGVADGDWFPYHRLTQLVGQVSDLGAEPEPVLERIGIEMMLSWYHFGPGRELIDGGADFVGWLAGPTGYRTLVRGPAEAVGRLQLSGRDDRGRLRVTTNTPLPRSLEGGLLIGGIQAPGDLDYVDVAFHGRSSTWLVEVH